MKHSLADYNQYKADFFSKLNYPFKRGRKILDLGCGDGTDALIFKDYYGLKVFGTDIYKHPNIKSMSAIKFKKASIYQLPFSVQTFDYIFLHDVLHHIDEPNQRLSYHQDALAEVKRVCKKNGRIIIAEGNRYNPLFYPHMVLMRGHQHFVQSYFKKLVMSVFKKSYFKYFEAHLYPPSWIKLWKVYERFMEAIAPKQFLAYNVAIIENI